MKFGEAWEKRDWGGVRPTWRAANAVHVKGEPLARTIRVASNRRAKKPRLVFRGSGLRIY